MPRYQPGFSEQDFERLKAAVEKTGKKGSFDASDALFDVLNTGVTDNAGDVAAILGDLADLGYLRPLGGNPPRWELAPQEGGQNDG